MTLAEVAQRAREEADSYLPEGTGFRHTDRERALLHYWTEQFENSADFNLRNRLVKELSRHLKEGPEHKNFASQAFIEGKDAAANEERQLSRDHDYAAAILSRLLAGGPL